MCPESENANLREGPFEDIDTLLTGPLEAEPRSILAQHGCSFLDSINGDCTITFPPQTKRRKLWPRTLSERYKILLPDGLELRQVFDRFQEVSQLYIVLPKHPNGTHGLSE